MEKQAERNVRRVVHHWRVQSEVGRRKSEAERLLYCGCAAWKSQQQLDVSLAYLRYLHSQADFLFSSLHTVFVPPVGMTSGGGVPFPRQYAASPKPVRPEDYQNSAEGGTTPLRFALCSLRSVPMTHIRPRAVVQNTNIESLTALYQRSIHSFPYFFEQRNIL